LTPDVSYGPSSSLEAIWKLRLGGPRERLDLAACGPCSEDFAGLLAAVFGSAN
jgi:hypothetical protein